MILVNKGQRTYFIKDGQGTKSLAPLCECEVEKTYGQELISASGNELAFKEEIINEVIVEKKEEKAPEVDAHAEVDQAANEEVAQIESTKQQKKKGHKK